MIGRSHRTRSERPPRRRTITAGAVFALLTLSPLCGGCGADGGRGGPVAPNLEPETSPDDGRSGIGRDLGTDERIVFAASTDGGGNDEVFSIKPDGAGLVRLTNTTAADRQPSWSPDRQRIVFTRTRDRGQPVGASGLDMPQRADVWIMDANGLSQRRLFAADEGSGYRFAAYPRFSPDGRQVAAMLLKEDGTTALALIDTVTGKAAEIATIGGAPSWSPDGERIAFAARPRGVVTEDEEAENGVPPSGDERRFFIFVIKKDGKELTAVSRPRVVGFPPQNPSSGPRYDAHTSPVWTPDGRSLVFSGSVWAPPASGEEQPRLTYGLYRIPSDGDPQTGPQRLTESPDFGAAFSPTGDGMVFTRFALGAADSGDASPQPSALVVATPDGTPVRTLDTGLFVEAADW